MNERVLCFGDHDSLIGIYTPAATPGRRPAVVLVNSGVVHRVGPNRLYVNLARQLAAADYPVLRFDLSSIGDSSPRSDALGFEKAAISETSAAMATVGRESGATRFILCGICSGADISFLTARDQPTVVGAVLINGRGLHGVTDDAGDALEAAVDSALGASTAAHYLWKSALFNPASWHKLVSGQVKPLKLLGVIGRPLMRRFVAHERVPATARELRAAFDAMLGRGTALLMVYSESDPAIDYMQMMFGKEMKKIAAHPNFTEVHMPAADHTFTPRPSRDELVAVLRRWADARFAG